MSRSIHLCWVKTIVFSTLIMLLKNVENATVISKRNPFFQSDVKRLGEVSQNPTSTQIPISNTGTNKPTITIEPPYLQHPNNLNVFCLQPKGQFPSASCNKYVNCWEGFAIEQTCPAGLLFNPLKLFCDYRGNVDCKGTPIDNTNISESSTFHSSDLSVFSTESPKSGETQGVNPALRQLCLRSTGVFPGSACGKYVNCWNGNPVEQDCPPGLHFSAVEGFCDYPDRAGCDGNKKTVSDKNDDCPLEFGTFRNRTDCSQYYTCAYSKVAAKFHCPVGFSFSDILGVCDYSTRVDCSREPQIYQRIRLKTMQDSLLASNAFAHPDLLEPSETGDIRCSTPYGFSRDRTNCSIYYVCEAGFVRATHVCPPGYSFSGQLDRCDYSEKVDCSLPPLTLYNFKNYQHFLSSIPNFVLKQIENCQPGNIFRLNPQCTTACRCQTHVAEIIQCAAGLAYDSKADKCLPTDVARC